MSQPASVLFKKLAIALGLATANKSGDQILAALSDKIGTFDLADLPAEIAALPARMTAVEAALGSGGGGSSDGSYTPIYKTTFTVANTVNSTVVRPVKAQFVTNHASVTGKDIRVQRLIGGVGQAYVPRVLSCMPVSGGYSYSVLFYVTLTANESQIWQVTYGDPAAPEPSYATADVQALARYNTGTRLGNTWAYLDSAQAYIPSDFATAGSQIFGNRDDSLDVALVDGVAWNGVGYNRITHDPNGGFMFAVDIDGTGHNSNRLAFSNGDAYESWRRQVPLDDGVAWHILSGSNGYTANIKVTIRYFTTGRWVLTIFQYTAINLTPTLQAQIDGQTFGIKFQNNVVESDPTLTKVLVVDPLPFTASDYVEAAI